MPEPLSSALTCALAFDVGGRRTGVAVGNSLSGTARSLAVLAMKDDQPDWDQVSRLIAEWSPQVLIVGEPLTLDGTEQPATHRARQFAAGLRKRHALPVMLVDERSSSREADRRFAERRRAGAARRRDAALLDADAAAIILERWLGS
ncbi:MAG TPA: Holliday junction resolvase RuvX [Aquimonas sp.]|nr:Holliday junction resolvase RuvX [Aquimonas sp.]